MDVSISSTGNSRTKRSPYKKSKSQHYSKDYTPLFEQSVLVFIEGQQRLSLNPHGASNPDEDAPRNLNPFLLVDYIADFQLAVEHSCQHHPDIISLLREYAGFGDSGLSKGRRSDLMQRVGREIERRGIGPSKYWKKIKGRAAR